LIDFRYHLISIVAILFALGIGILMGSAVLDDRILSGLENQVDDLSARNGELRGEVERLTDRLEAAESFAVAAEPRITDGALLGEAVVLIEFEGTDGNLIDNVRERVTRAEGRVATTISITDKFSLGDQSERDELALILRSTLTEGAELRAEAGRLFGERASTSAAGSPRSPDAATPDRLLNSLLEELEQADFIGVDRQDETITVPTGASFLIIGGNDSAPPFELREFLLELTTQLGEQGAGVLVAEPATSRWDLVTAVREDGQARNEVTTVDQADTAAGRVAIVLGLELTESDVAGHYGVRAGATAVIPEESQT
jgi:Copper transport outer membrane protein, MctB